MIACLPHYTSGQTYYYPAFNAARSEDALKFAHEFGEVLAMPIMLEAVMRVRASRGVYRLFSPPSIITNIVWLTDLLGLRMSSFHGNFFVRSTDLLAMPAVPQDQSYAIEVQIEETITSSFVVFQTAVLHTTCYGVSCRRCYRLWFLTVTFQVNAVFGSSRSHFPQRKIFQSYTRRRTRWRLQRSWRTRRLNGCLLTNLRIAGSLCSSGWWSCWLLTRRT